MITGKIRMQNGEYDLLLILDYQFNGSTCSSFNELVYCYIYKIALFFVDIIYRIYSGSYDKVTLVGFSLGG